MTHVVDDADDDGADRGVLGGDDLAGAVAFVEHEHAVAGAGVHRVDGDEVVGERRAGGIGALDDEQLLRVVEGVVDRRGDGADHAAEDHAAVIPEP